MDLILHTRGRWDAHPPPSCLRCAGRRAKFSQLSRRRSSQAVEAKRAAAVAGEPRKLGRFELFLSICDSLVEVYSVIQSCGADGRLEEDAVPWTERGPKWRSLGGRPANSTRSSYVDFSFSLSPSSLYRSVSRVSHKFPHTQTLHADLSADHAACSLLLPLVRPTSHLHSRHREASPYSRTDPVCFSRWAARATLQKDTGLTCILIGLHSV